MEGSLRQIRQCSTQMAPSVASAMTGSTSQWQLLLNIKSRLVLFRVRWKRTGKGSYSQWAQVWKLLYAVVVVTLLVAEAPIGNTGGTFSLLILIVLITHYWLCVEKQWMITCFPLFRKFTVRAVRTRCALRDLIIFGVFLQKIPVDQKCEILRPACLAPNNHVTFKSLTTPAGACCEQAVFQMKWPLSVPIIDIRGPAKALCSFLMSCFQSDSMRAVANILLICVLGRGEKKRSSSPGRDKTSEEMT